MVKKLSRGQKAWATRKANQVKGNMAATLDKANWKVGFDKNLLEAQKATNKFIPNVYTSAPTLTLCGQLEDVIMLLETRISNAIAKINSLM